MISVVAVKTIEDQSVLANDQELQNNTHSTSNNILNFFKQNVFRIKTHQARIMPCFDKTIKYLCTLDQRFGKIAVA